MFATKGFLQESLLPEISIMLNLVLRRFGMTFRYFICAAIKGALICT